MGHVAVDADTGGPDAGHAAAAVAKSDERNFPDLDQRWDAGGGRLGAGGVVRARLDQSVDVAVVGLEVGVGWGGQGAGAPRSRRQADARATGLWAEPAVFGQTPLTLPEPKPQNRLQAQCGQRGTVRMRSHLDPRPASRTCRSLRPAPSTASAASSRMDPAKGQALDAARKAAHAARSNRSRVGANLGAILLLYSYCGEAEAKSGCTALGTSAVS